MNQLQSCINYCTFLVQQFIFSGRAQCLNMHRFMLPFALGNQKKKKKDLMAPQMYSKQRKPSNQMMGMTAECKRWRLGVKDDIWVEIKPFQDEWIWIFSIGLTVKNGFFFGCLLVGLGLKKKRKEKENPVVISTYSGISLVSWLEWKGKTVEDIHMRQRQVRTATLSDRTHTDIETHT